MVHDEIFGDPKVVTCARYPATALAKTNATAAATPPMSSVCTALRNQAIPVTQPFTAPKTKSAIMVIAAET